MGASSSWSPQGPVQACVGTASLLVLQLNYMTKVELRVNCNKLRCYNSPTKIQQDATIYQNFIIPYLYEAQHVSGDAAHHQVPRTVLASSGLSYVEGCLYV